MTPRLLPLVAALLATPLLAQTQAPATADNAPLRLRLSNQLAETIPAELRQELPVFLFGDSVRGRPDLEAVVDGNAELRRGDLVIRAGRIEYFQPEDRARATGGVRVNRAGNIYEGDSLELRLEAFEGSFLSPRFSFLSNGGEGRAERVDFIDRNRLVARNASFSTCRADGMAPGWVPDWLVRATALKIDEEQQTGEAEGGVLLFKNVPLLPIPQFSFPLSDRRKSGFLPPTLNLDSVSGLEFTQPYYWNIAPNRDATLYPSLMTRRGVDLGGEFRYLERDYAGQVRAGWMPNDALRGRARWSVASDHNGRVDMPALGLAQAQLSLQLNRVSDDDYWRDFPRVLGSLTQRLLPSDASLSFEQGALSGQLRAQKWQTLQDVSAPIVPPYDRLPQLGLQWRGEAAGGLELRLEGEYTRFMGDVARTAQPDAQRLLAVGQISRPWRAPGWFVVPRVQWHATSYSFDTALATGERSAQRVVPTFSLDAGLVLERQATWFGRNLRQTLEPRAYLVYTPWRDQARLPVYDSAANDFSFATIYADNAYLGNDRISDSRQLTVGVTSRLLDPQNGTEAARFGIAQRLRLADQRVTLPGEAPATDRFSDLLLGGALNWTSQWALESTVQFNPKTSRSVRSAVGARYSPQPYRVVSAAYRLQRGASESLDLGWQWPINRIFGGPPDSVRPGGGLGAGRWYSVGRINYSMRDRKLVDGTMGLEYDAGCWITRVVLERLQRSDASANTRVMVQFELVGFSRLGSNPLQYLRDNIPRYQLLREQVDPPSRFTRYD